MNNADTANIKKTTPPIRVTIKKKEGKKQNKSIKYYKFYSSRVNKNMFERRCVNFIFIFFSR